MPTRQQHPYSFAPATPPGRTTLAQFRRTLPPQDRSRQPPLASWGRSVRPRRWAFPEAARRAPGRSAQTASIWGSSLGSIEPRELRNVVRMPVNSGRHRCPAEENQAIFDIRVADRNQRHPAVSAATQTNAGETSCEAAHRIIRHTLQPVVVRLPVFHHGRGSPQHIKENISNHGNVLRARSEADVADPLIEIFSPYVRRVLADVRIHRFVGRRSRPAMGSDAKSVVRTSGTAGPPAALTLD